MTDVAGLLPGPELVEILIVVPVKWLNPTHQSTQAQLGHLANTHTKQLW